MLGGWDDRRIVTSVPVGVCRVRLPSYKVMGKWLKGIFVSPANATWDPGTFGERI